MYNLELAVIHHEWHQRVRATTFLLQWAKLYRRLPVYKQIVALSSTGVLLFSYLLAPADELWESTWFINNSSSKTTTCCAVADILNSWLVFQTNIRHLLYFMTFYCFIKIVNVTIRSSRTSTELDCFHLAIIISDEHQETPQLHPNHGWSKFLTFFQVRLKLLSLHVHV